MMRAVLVHATRLLTMASLLVAGGRLTVVDGEGTFVFVSNDLLSDGFYLVIHAEKRGEVVQVTGRSIVKGKHAASLSGTYYPRSNEFRGKSQQVAGNREITNLDGRYVRESELYHFWDSARQKFNFTAKRVNAADAVGNFGSGRFKISIRKSGTGYAVSGNHDEFTIKGSYLSKTNEIAASSSKYDFDGIYDPYSKGIFVWASPKSGVIAEDSGFALYRSAAATPAILDDVATRPGAVWKQSETFRSEIGGTWTLQANGRTFKAKWNNGASADLTLDVFNATEVVVSRHDKEGVSKGLKAKYTGQRVGKKVAGDVDWTWANGETGKGKWSAELP